MKKLAVILLVVLFALLSCSREEVEVQPVVTDGRPTPEGEKVAIEFDVPGFAPATKALDEGGTLNSLHLAVFGGSGYLKEYVQATPVQIADYTYSTFDKDGNPVERTVPCYRFTVMLTLSDSPRTIHFLGNGPSVMPFGYDTAVMPVQLSSNGEMAYWQKIYLPHGVRAKRNSNGDFIDKDDNVIPEGGKGYIADDETELLFQGIPLVRNWSKIVLSADDDSFFTPISLAAVNVPMRGSMAPYSASTGFIEDYQERSFVWLESTAKYPGNLPVGTSFDATIPEASDFYGPVFGERVADANGGAVYMYERPEPSTNVPPSYVIIYGHYCNPDDLDSEGDYFYKVDLMETKKVGDTEWKSYYYPIYRNFKYQVIVKKILSKGYPTPFAASTSAGSADVSADVNTSHLSDISDGVGRLHITEWMSKTFTRQQEDPVSDLHVYFSVNGEAVMDADKVTVTALPAEDGGPDIIKDLEIGPASVVVGSRGWRAITFRTVELGLTVRTQKIRVTGTHEYGRLYRDITVTLQPIQKMKVTCEQPRIAAEKGLQENVSISIPDGLVESMFPLVFTVEAEKMSLTPDTEAANNNLPVVYGTSISENEGYAGKPAFQFERTLSWSEYLGLTRYEDDDEQTWRRLTMYFKTNCAENGSVVWVYNEYFDKDYDKFSNYRDKVFKNFTFTSPIPQESDVEVPVSFEMVEDDDGVYPDDYPEVTIAPVGMRLNIGNGIQYGDEPGTYVIKPTGHYVNLTFISTTPYADEFAVDITASEYSPAHIQTCKFQEVWLIDGHPMSNKDKWSSSAWSNVAWGHVNSDGGKNVLFGYKDDPAKLNTPVTLELTNLQKLNNSLTFPYTPSGPRSATSEINYHEIELKTIKGEADVKVRIMSPGYVVEEVTAGRFKGNIRTMTVTTSNVFKSGNTYSFSPSNPTFTIAADNGNVTVTFSEITNIDNGVTFDPGKTYTMTIHSNISTQTLFYVDIWFKKVNSDIYMPENMSADFGEVTRYPGDDRQYVWSIPRGHRDIVLTFTPPAGRQVHIESLYIKAFNGYLIENGVRVD